MRSLLLTAFFLAMTLPACAETAKTQVPAETVAISGYSIPTPVRIDQPVEWKVVRDYVPAALLETPKKAPPASEIYNEVNRLMREKMTEYDTALTALAADRKGEYPGQSLEDVKYALADLFVTGDGDAISPDVQKLAYEYAALQYLHEAFETELKKQGYDPEFHAPGPVPAFVPEYPPVR